MSKLNFKSFLLLLLLKNSSSEFINDDTWNDPKLKSYSICSNIFKEANYQNSALKDVLDIGQSEIQQSAILSKQKLWPNGKILYRLDAGFTPNEQKKLACAFLFFQEKTCIRFEKMKETDRNFIKITKNDWRGGCFSETLGMSGGQQILNLDQNTPQCWVHGTIIHECMHAIGFFHEQSREDRDAYINIHWTNIPKTWWRQFYTGKELGIQQKLVGNYDYGSIMHYSRHTWDSGASMTANREPIGQNNNLMGNRATPTAMDVQKVMELYGCTSSLKKKCDRLWQTKYTAYALESCLVLNTDLKTFENAHQSCTDFTNGRIVQLTDRSDFNSLAGVLAQWAGFDSVMIGLKRGTNSNWQWYSDKGRTVGARNLEWAEGEPSNSRNYEHCAEYRFSSAKLNDIGCNKIRQIVCQYDDVSQARCDQLWKYKYTAYALNSCLVLQSQYGNFEYGKKSCVDFANGHLVQLPDKKSYQTFKNVLAGWAGFNSVYVGLKQDNSGTWKWYSTEKYMESQLPWRKGEPSNSGGNEGCAEYLYNSENLNDIQCSKLRRSVCQYV